MRGVTVREPSLRMSGATFLLPLYALMAWPGAAWQLPVVNILIESVCRNHFETFGVIFFMHIDVH